MCLLLYFVLFYEGLSHSNRGCISESKSMEALSGRRNDKLPEFGYSPQGPWNSNSAVCPYSWLPDGPQLNTLFSGNSCTKNKHHYLYYNTIDFIQHTHTYTEIYIFICICAVPRPSSQFPMSFSNFKRKLKSEFFSWLRHFIPPNSLDFLVGLGFFIASHTFLNLMNSSK